MGEVLQFKRKIEQTSDSGREYFKGSLFDMKPVQSIYKTGWRPTFEMVQKSPVWKEGKLNLWYGDQWVSYDEYTEEKGEYGRSLYQAGAYMQTLALNRDVITKPALIADAVLRANQYFSDQEFARTFLEGLFDTGHEIDSLSAADFLLVAGNSAKAGDWPTYHDHESVSPRTMGLAIKTFAKPDWLPAIAERMSSLANQ